MLVILTFPSDVAFRAGGDGLLVEALDAEQDPRNPRNPAILEPAVPSPYFGINSAFDAVSMSP
jgi:hypothetical protein